MALLTKFVVILYLVSGLGASILLFQSYQQICTIEPDLLACGLIDLVPQNIQKENNINIFLLMSSNKIVDIEKVIKDKNPTLRKLMPKFLLNYIKRILHEDEFNNLFTGLQDYKGIEFVKKALEKYKIKIETYGAENIKPGMRYIFASNHPIGGFDSLVLMHEVDKYAGSLRFIVNDVLLSMKNYEPLFVGVNKYGATARESLKILDGVYESDHQVLIFPAGLVSRRKKGVVRDPIWYKSFIVKAKQYKRDVIPVRISGELGSFFYNLANFRTAIGIKANLEMFYLADEAFKHRETTIKIRFGEPIPYTFFSSDKKPEEWSAYVQDKVYEMNF